MKINKEAVLAALRSGEYKQILRQMKHKDDEYCAIGLIAHASGYKGNYGTGDIFSKLPQLRNVLSNEAIAKMKELGWTRETNILGGSILLLNDSMKMPFDKIADFLEIALDD